MKESRNNFTGRLIDIHTHAEGFDYYNFSHGLTPTSMETLFLSQVIDRSKIDFAIAFPIQNTLYFTPSSYISNESFSASGVMDFPFQLENIRLLQSIKNLEIKNLLPFLSFSLNDKVAEQVEFLETKISDDYVYGLKYHPQCDRHNILDIENHPKLIKILKEYNLPILVHSGKSAVANPINVLKFALNNPDIRICVAHLGRFNELFFNKYFQQPIKNLYFDMSPFDFLFQTVNKENAFFYELRSKDKKGAIQRIYELLGPNLLWGSDYPWINPLDICNVSEKSNMTYDSVVETLFSATEEIVNNVSNRNILDFIYGKNCEY